MDQLSQQLALTMPDTSVTLEDIQSARARIASAISPTPLASSDYLCELWGAQVFFKLEMLHTTGSFKERGALNKLLTLDKKETERGVIAASAGNHAQALAHHAKRLSIPATIIMPVNAPLIKVQNTRASGAEVELFGTCYDEALAHSRELAEMRGLTFIHGFDDPQVIAGQGTIGLELLEQCPDLQCVIIPVGGGGLLSGIATAIKAIKPEVRIVGVQCDAVTSMQAALTKGAPVEVAGGSTIADGIAVRKVGELCLELAAKHMDDLIIVNEDEIAHAILLMLEREKTVVEGAGSVGVAALHSGRVSSIRGKKIAVILSGGNIDVNRLARIIAKGLVKDGRLVKLRLLVPDLPGQLARILESVAELRANILEVQHERAFSAAQVGHTAIDLMLETRGEDHIGEILGALQQQGYHVERQHST